MSDKTFSGTSTNLQTQFDNVEENLQHAKNKMFYKQTCVWQRLRMQGMCYILSTQNNILYCST